MEKGKRLFRSRLFQIGCLAAFTAMALACASKKDAVDFMDGFVDGYNSTRYGYEKTDSVVNENIDTNYDFAMNPNK